MIKHDKLKKLKLDNEKIILCICIFIIIIILFKVVYIILYHFKADSVFNNKTNCATYKTLYVAQLHKGDLADIQPILYQATNEECIKNPEPKNPKEVTPVVKPKEPLKEDKAYSALTVHEIEK